MPFPFAHPAAVLPLRRYCPRHLDFGSLVIGSLAPDFAASIDDWEYFSHTAVGIFGFCLPFGIVTVILFHRLRRTIVAIMPRPHRDALLPLCNRLAPSAFQVVISILIGSGIHLVWDLFTHDYSRLARSINSMFALEVVPVNQIIWLVSSIGGLVVLGRTYWRLLRSTKIASPIGSWMDVHGHLRWLCFSLVPLAVALPVGINDAGLSHFTQLLRATSMYYLGSGYITLLIAGIYLQHTNSRPANASGRSPQGRV